MGIFDSPEASFLLAKSLLDERDNLILRRLESRAKFKAALAEDAALQSRLNDIRAAGRLIGITIHVPTEPKSYDSRAALEADMKSVRPSKTWEPGNCVPEFMSGRKIENPKDYGLEGPSTGPENSRIRDHVLAFLEKATRGSSARLIRDHLEQVLGIKTHEKTVGMTLYRLSKEGSGLVHREGRTWFFGPPKAGAEDPGAVTPGSITDRSEGKEDET